MIFFVRLATDLKFHDGIPNCQSDTYGSWHRLNQSTRLLGVLMSKLTTVNGRISNNSELPAQKFALIINSRPYF